MILKNMKKLVGIISVLTMLLTGCSDVNKENTDINNLNNQSVMVEENNTANTETIADGNVGVGEVESFDINGVVVSDSTETTNNATISSTSSDSNSMFEGYKIIEVDGGNLSGYRQPNVAVDIGYGDREYWAFTNEYGQLVKVVAKQIILQDDSKEPVNSDGRYYNDEAKVPGTERADLDEGHVIADSLGGVSNAYNITPQESTLNRHGDQAYMEKAIRDAGGCSDFVAIISYPNTSTQIPSHYSYTYTINGNVINDEFNNVNPDEYNASLNNAVSSSNSNSNSNASTSSNTQVNTSSSEVVYWTPNGKSYHTTKGCSTLSRSKTILEGTIEESGKHDPCDRCH